MTSAATPGRKSIGVYLGSAERAEAARIATAIGIGKTQVLRLAVEAGLPLVAQRLGVADATEQRGEEA